MTTAALTTSRHRLRATLAAAVLGSTLLGGCAVFSPMQTDYAYQAADGVNATFGDLDVRGLVIVSDAKDAAGNLVGQLVNSSNEDLQVAFATEAGPGGQVTVPRRSSVNLGEEEPLTLPKVGVNPGDVLQLQVATAGTGQNILTVPVLPSLAYYEDSRPPGSSGPATATPSASPSASASH
ncbi:hypothetical protein N802_13495 [Knoellia sinensis KCTC 19936]|uniref:Uncharacterized protein n=1 Tax=Knoellia sinensis KCTC 19936 TaxID=1385520 RepID=A0A0A0JFS6_9MICO|nr:hypothetical protein [Knoellia sinensis]KGN34441.1 hypothetical protein N802_13495 [Knoellia sinensis KCTC 19936]